MLGRGVLRAETDAVTRPGLPVPAAYDHRFGSSPFLPSNAQAAFSGFLSPDEIPSAAYCSHCHADVHSQWRQSAHANAFRTPWYTKNINDLIATRGIAYTRHCEGCHNPAALFTGALTPNSPVSRPNDEDGVTCMVCHSISAVQGTRGTGSYVFNRPAVMLDAAGAPVAGIPADAEILAHPERHVQAVMRPLYRSSEFCAACHKAAIPMQLNEYKWLRSFTTYDEWQQSSWSKETPLSFYEKPQASSCQTCHMVAEPARDPAAFQGKVASHRWLGANTGVPVQYGYAEQLKRVTDYLRDDKLQVDLFAVTVEHSRPAVGGTSDFIAPLGAASERKPFTILPGDWLRVDVVVRNKGIGHSLVPELRDFFESWVDFAVTDDRGRTVYHSGAVGADHQLDPDARSYTAQLVSNGGESIDHHDIWRTQAKAYDATVLPGRSDVIRYRFHVPDAAKTLHISAAVNYRRFNRTFTNWVFGEDGTAPDRFPTIALASGSYDLTVGFNSPHPQATLPGDLTDLLRWNNYGIGMIDRQQYGEAVDAFRQVVALDPKYEPGYVNIAVAEYMRGRFDASLQLLSQALAIKPADARAQYYRGLNLRWQGHYDEAIAAYAPVADRYPRFRQVHQELGYIYMVRRRFAESRAEYEKVLAIDPEDPNTHRWLGPVLEALGDHTGALREAAIAAQTGNDTAAGFTAQRFWRDHLSVASKAMPRHVYSEKNQADDADVHRVLNLQNPPSYIWIEHE